MYIAYMEVGMPLLQVRDLPEDVYEKLSMVAAADNRSIAQETIVLLRKALGMKEERTARRRKLFEEMRYRKLSNTGSFPDAAELIREDRDR
jgi:plasmid stability protein